MMKPVAVVTGGVQGIGLAVGEELARQGWDLAILDLQDAAEAVKKVRALGAFAKGYRVDVGDTASVEAACKEVDGDFSGRVQGLVNCAGIVSRKAPDDETDEEWRHAINVNVVGARRTVKFVAPMMKMAGNGAIVSISSIAARFGAEAAGSLVYRLESRPTWHVQTVGEDVRPTQHPFHRRRSRVDGNVNDR